MILLFTEPFTVPQWVSAIAHASIALIALVNLFFAFYLLKYQRERDKSNQKLERQNLRIDWLKELVIKPQWNNVEDCYSKIASIAEGFKAQGLDVSQKDELLNNIKQETSKVRKTFIDRLNVVRPDLHSKAMNSLDTMLDGISQVIFDAGINLSDTPTFDREILNKVTYSRNDLITIIFSYNGEVD